MTEKDAQEWISGRWGLRATDKLRHFGELLEREMAHQNLIAASTLQTLWTRHFLDSAQLVPLAGSADSGDWVDIGSGAGLPGVVAAILQPNKVCMIEPRRRRVDFLESVIDALDLNAYVSFSQAQTYAGSSAAVISARAVGSLAYLFESSVRFSTPRSIWLLPKGRSAQIELEEVRTSWQGTFHVEQSLTAADSSIVVARGVQPL